MDYDISCPHCNHQFEHEAVHQPLIKGCSWGWYKDGECPNCKSVFTFEWDCDHDDAVIIPVFKEKTNNG